MTAYYNEFDNFAADWLEELIKDNLIVPGIVDRRSITEVEPNDLKDFTQCHFFAGIGGWSYAARLAGWPDNRPMWTGSPPCQPFSTAGNRKGKDDNRHLWPVFFNLIRECRPPAVFGEQVAAAIRMGWFDNLQTDLEKENYASGMVVLPACSVGAPHKRDRLFYFASLSDTDCKRKHSSLLRMEQGREQKKDIKVDWSGESFRFNDEKLRIIPTEPALFPLVNGISNRVGILRGAGNAIVPQVGAEVIRAYMESLDERIC